MSNHTPGPAEEGNKLHKLIEKVSTDPDLYEAAPEMYELLKEMANPGETYEITGVWHSAIEKLIAKAEGSEDV